MSNKNVKMIENQRLHQMSDSATTVQEGRLTALLYPDITLDAKSYREVMIIAREAYVAGIHKLIFDLSEVTSIGRGGLTTLALLD